jgi:hypothetical protein
MVLWAKEIIRSRNLPGVCRERSRVSVRAAHGRLLFGDRFTTVKHGEIGPGLLADMLKQLGLKKGDL